MENIGQQSDQQTKALGGDLSFDHTILKCPLARDSQRVTL